MFAHIQALFWLYFACKLLLLCIAHVSPGPGYDTSTNLLLLRAQSASSENTLPAAFAKQLVSKLVRWDALYFISVAQRGYLYEQEWAWGWGYTKSLGCLSKALSSASSSPLYAQAYAGILLSHVAHLLSVLILYALVRQMPMTQEKQRAKVAFIAASMHIFSSAGLFLSAPYSESLFSMLNFLGMFMHTCIPWNLPLESYGPLSLLHILLSGACFALATTVRSNGIFSGILYFHYVYMLFQSRINLRTLLTVVVVGLSAAMILSAMLFPQYMAYQDYCIVPLEGATRPWCSRSLPSIYSWVQEHYWNVGFLRYWTMSNIPLFLLALPMLSVLVMTGIVASGLSSQKHAQYSKRTAVYIFCLALPQVVLALLAFTTFHVQIINRIATGYPIWYIVLAHAMVYPGPVSANEKTVSSVSSSSWMTQIRGYLCNPTTQQLIFRGMFMYSIIQGGLYASFMPPA